MTIGARSAILIWLAVLAACAVVIAHARFAADMSAFLPRAPNASERMLVDQLRSGTAAQLILVGIEGGDQTIRAALSKTLARRLRADPAFVTVANGEPVDAGRDFRFLFRNRYALSPAVTPERFTERGLHMAIAASIDRLASPTGDMMAALLPDDPTGETLGLLTRLDDAQMPHSTDGVWMARDGKRALLLVRTKAGGADIDGQQAAIATISHDFAAARQMVGNQAAPARLLMTGPGVFAVQARTTIRRAVEHVTLIGGALIIILLMLVYRSLPVLLLGLLPVLTGVMVGIASVSLAFGVVNDLTLGFGTSLLGEAVDYSIYLFIQADSGADWRRDYWPTIRLGMATSICGFATLLFSAFPGLAQLGLYSIVGLLSAALVTRFVLPHLLPGGFAVRDLSDLGARLARLTAAAAWLRPGVIFLSLAAAILLLQRPDIWNPSLAALSPVSASAQALDGQLRGELGASDVRDMVIAPAATAEAALQAAELAGALLQPLIGQNVIAGFESPARFLPSIATQKARLAALPPGDLLNTRLNDALAGLPVRKATLAPFLGAVHAARHGKPVTRADLAGTSFAAAVDGLLVRQGARWDALLPLRAPAGGVIDAARVRAALAGGPAGFPVLLIDLKQAANQLYDGYLRAAVWLSLAGLVCVVLLLFIALRSVSRVLRVLVPLVAAVLVVAAGLALAGERLTLLHLIGLMLIVAVGSNYALFFERGQVTPRTLISLSCANACTVAGFSPLIVSGVPVLQALGVTVAPGTLLALIFSALLAAVPRPAAVLNL